MGCNTSKKSTKKTTVVPEGKSIFPIIIERKESGEHMQLRIALTCVFDTQLVTTFATQGAELKLTRDDFLNKVFPALCKGAEMPDPKSPEFIEMADELFNEMDTNKNTCMCTDEFCTWYLDRGHDTYRGETESFMSTRFFAEIKKMVRRQEDNLAKEWLKKRGGYTEEEVTKALTGLFKVYDANGDGVLDDVEFGNMMLEVMDARLDALGERSKGIAHDRLSRKAAGAIILMMDSDGDGTLDLKEFQDTMAESLKWTEDRVEAAAERLSPGEPKLAAHLREFFLAMTWCTGKFIKQGGAKRAINLSRFFDVGVDPDAYWNQS